MTNVLLARRLAAIFYDALLLISVLFFAAMLSLPLTYEQIDTYNYHPLYQGYLFLVSFLYFAIPWMRSGQTLGMRSWKVRLSNKDETKLSFKQVSIRFLIAIISWLILGIGFLWAIFDKDNRTWHDIVSKTNLVWSYDYE
jgi:uncharacterized RDD family membrane protein YckC